MSPTTPTIPAVTALARDGTEVRLRPLCRGERDLVARFFEGLSEESRRRRFLQPLPRLPEAMLRHLTDVDGRRHVALVAEVGGEVAGIARFVALPDEPGAAAASGGCCWTPSAGSRRAPGSAPSSTWSTRATGGCWRCCAPWACGSPTATAWSRAASRSRWPAAGWRPDVA